MKRKKDLSKLRMRIVATIVLSLLALVFIAPYFWMLSNSFKSNKEILLDPTNILPKVFTLDSYIKVLTTSQFFMWLRNSLFIAITNTCVILLTSSLVGYILSKYNFKLRNVIFMLILATMMVPSQVTMIPNFLLISRIGWYNSLLSLVIPSFIGGFGIFLCKQFIDEIPKELFESAMLDGASDIRIFFSIVIPAIRPALGSLTIFTFMQYWNDYLNPLIMLNSTENMTLPLALTYFTDQHKTDLSATLAAAALMTIPVTIVFIIFQKQFIKGITMTGMK